MPRALDQALDPGEASVLRVETTINDAAGFETCRTPDGKPRAPLSWHRMREGIADLHRRTEVSQATNDRYQQALASIENILPQLLDEFDGDIAPTTTDCANAAELLTAQLPIGIRSAADHAHPHR
jgi:hypothetical protein